MSHIDHILLYTAMVLLAFVYDYYQRARWRGVRRITRFDTSLTATLLAAVFIVAEGLRFGRGVDQERYAFAYLNPDLFSADKAEHTGWLWMALNKYVLLHDPTTETLTYGIIFVVFASIFLCGLWRFTKDYEGRSLCMLGLGMLGMNYLVEWAVRQGISFAFVLLALHFLERKRWVAIVPCLLVAFNIHPGNSAAILFFALAYRFATRRTLPWVATVPVFLFLEFTTSLESVQNLLEQLTALVDPSSVGRGYDAYTNMSVVGGEAEMMYEEHSRSMLTQLLSAMFYASILVVCDKVGRYDPRHIYLFNVVALGCLLYEPFHLASTPARLFVPMACMWFVPLAILLYHRREWRGDKVTRVAVALSLLYLVLYYGRYIFFYPEASYVWWNN